MLSNIADQFDFATGRGKVFDSWIRQDDGWCEVDEARGITPNGSQLHVGLKDGRFLEPAEMAALSVDDRRIARFIMSAVEGVGQVWNLQYANAQGWN